MERIPKDNRLVVFEYLGAFGLLAVYQCSQKWSAALSPRTAAHIWARVRPSDAVLQDHLDRATPFTTQILINAYGDFILRDCKRSCDVVSSSGNLPLLKWMAAKYAYACTMYNEEALRAACGGGHLCAAAWLADQIDEKELRFLHLSSHNYCALQAACANGHSMVAQWLTGRYPDIIDEMMRDEDLLTQACARGHLSIAKWLAYLNEYGNPSCARHIDGYALLVNACTHGHAHIAQWVVCRFRMRRAAPISPHHQFDTEEDTEYISDGQLDIEYISDRYFGELISLTSNSGHLTSVQWLLDQFDLIASDGGVYLGRDEFDRMLHGACDGGHLHIAEWLIVHYSDRLTNMSRRLDEQRQAARAAGHGQIAEWLTLRFGLDSERGN